MKRKTILPLIAVLFACTACAPADGGLHLSEELTLPLGETRSLGATASGGVTYSSSDETIVHVDGAGRVTGLFTGTATVTAAFGRVRESCKVTVTAEAAGMSGLTLVWNDEFDGLRTGGVLDPEKWGYQLGIRDDYHGTAGPEHWGNNERQYYTEEAVSLGGGVLTVTARREEREDCGYSSGRILTRDKFSFTYGYAEAKIALPAVTGLWPAFWMLPQPDSFSSTANRYGGWAANGEIDILEARGREPYKAVSTLHFGDEGRSTYLTQETTLPASTEEWHTYGLEWRAEYIAWRIDGEEVFRVAQADWRTSAVSKEENPVAPFDSPFYLLFNLAVGGNFDGGREPDPSFGAAEMKADYVRVYALPET